MDGFWTGRFPDYDPGRDTCRIEPVFADPDGGSPRAVGFVIEIATAAGDVHRLGFEVGHFHGRARRTAQELVQQGRVADGTKLLYGLAACPVGNGEAAPATWTPSTATRYR